MSDLEKPNDFVKLVHVVNIENDIERPHYEFLIGGHEFSLIMQENIDSESYRKGLVKAIDIALDKNPDMKEFIKSKDTSKSLIYSDIEAYKKVRDFLKQVQEEFNDKEIDRAIFEKYGDCKELVQVTAVSLERDTVRLRLNFIDDSNKYAIQHGVLVSIPINNVYVNEQPDERQAVAEYVDVFMEEYRKNKELQKEIQVFQRKAFVEYIETFDLMADNVLLSKVRDFNESVSCRVQGNIRARQYAVEQRVNRIANIRNALKVEISTIADNQKKQANRFFGLGKYYDRFFNKERCEEEQRHKEELERKVILCDKEEKLATLPSENLKRLVHEVDRAYEREIAILTQCEPDEKKMTKEDRKNLILKYRKDRTASAEVER